MTKRTKQKPDAAESVKRVTKWPFSFDKCPRKGVADYLLITLAMRPRRTKR